MKRGFTYAEAVQYAGVKRRTFDAHWRPRLSSMQHGTCVIFDRLELDLLFEQFKAQGTGVAPARQADDASILSQQNGVRNERPIMKGVSQWAEKLPASMPAKKEPGKLTSGGEALDFASAASAVMRKRKAG